MSDKGDSQEATAFDAIAAVSDEGFKRNSSGTRFKVWGGYTAPAVIVILAAWGAYIWSNKLPTLGDLPVAILLPETDKGLVWDNAKRQQAGFELAFKDNKVLGENKHYLEFNYKQLISDDPDQTIKETLDAIKNWYYKDGIRVFLITMSGAVDRIKPGFTAWSKETDPRDSPILVATVASAPDIADLEHGVLRHYIRSRDESDVLSTYIESLQPAPNVVGVFYVNDKYGETAKDIFNARLGTEVVDPVVVELADTEGAIAEKVKKFIREQNSDKSAVAVIVGYGEMIANTLLSLMDETELIEGVTKRFEGPILVVSTFTESTWRPNGLSDDFAKRIHTVGPGTNEDNSEYKGVVFQFAYMTLDRALQCKGERGAESFWDCWNSDLTTDKTNRGKKWADVEFTANGDSHVSLILLDHARWSD